MNLLRRWFGDRRKETVAQQDDRRRGGVIKRWKDTGERLDHSIDMLNQTISMNTGEFAALMRESREREITLVQNGASRHVEFGTFAEICKFQYSPEKSLMTLCRNPSHEAAASGIAPCQRAVCPFYTERKK